MRAVIYLAFWGGLTGLAVMSRVASFGAFVVVAIWPVIGVVGIITLPTIGQWLTLVAIALGARVVAWVAATFVIADINKTAL